MVTKIDYGKREVDICLSVMVEFLTILGEFREHIVLIGGWVPYFLLEKNRKEHTGSIDIDIAIDFTEISDDTYNTILQLLKARGYEEGKQPFIFKRTIRTKEGTTQVVEVDFLSGEYGGTGRSHRTQKIQDISARKARGCDLVFQHNFPIRIKKEMPDGSVNEVKIKVAGIIPFLVMKGMALWENFKEKHAYDIYFTILHYPGSIGELVKTFESVKYNKLVLEGLGKIRAKFNDINSIGPVWVVNFEGIEEEEEKEGVKRDVYERVNAFLDGLEIEEFRDRT